MGGSGEHERNTMNAKDAVNVVNTCISLIQCDGSYSPVGALLYKPDTLLTDSAERPPQAEHDFHLLDLDQFFPSLEIDWCIDPFPPQSLIPPNSPAPLTTNNWPAIMICALSLHPYPPVLTQQWVEMYAWPSYCREQGGVGEKDRCVTDWKLECFCWERQSEIIKKDEQRAPAQPSRFMGGGYAADGLLHTYKWHSTVQYFQIAQKMKSNSISIFWAQHLSTHTQTHSQSGSQQRQRHITPHTELKSHYQLTPVVKKLIGSIHTLIKGIIYYSVPKTISTAA